QDRSPPCLRVRHPLLYGRGARAPRRPDCTRRSAAALSRMGYRLGQRGAGAYLDRARVGIVARAYELSVEFEPETVEHHRQARVGADDEQHLDELPRVKLFTQPFPRFVVD